MNPKPVSVWERVAIRILLLLLTASTFHFEMMLTRMYERILQCNVY